MEPEPAGNWSVDGGPTDNSGVVIAEGFPDAQWGPARFNVPKTWDEVRRLYMIRKPPPPDLPGLEEPGC